MASIDGIEDHSEANIAGEDDEEVYNLYVDNTATVTGTTTTAGINDSGTIAATAVPGSR